MFEQLAPIIYIVIVIILKALYTNSFSLTLSGAMFKKEKRVWGRSLSAPS